MVKQEVLVRC